MSDNALRRPRGRAYEPAHPQIKGVGPWSRVCGKCSKPFPSQLGDKRHPILGYLCQVCAPPKGGSK